MENIFNWGAINMNEILYLVIPCYNEEEVLYETSSRLLIKLNSMVKEGIVSHKSRILFVNDGSKDKTWDIIKELHQKNNIFSGINLSRNRGHQNALLAGLMIAKDYADMVISLDADLQDDINVMDKFVEECRKGNDIVYGVRSSRDKDTFFKKYSALFFYKLMNKMGGEIIYNHADYRLMSKRALNSLSEYKEVNLFLRGIVTLIGYDYSVVEYERNQRFAGESKYPLKKMIIFAMDGITSFSIKPIRIISVLGFVIFILSFLALIYSLTANFLNNTVAGWTSIVISIWMIGGIQLLSVGVIGEYIGKIYSETKNRPRFIIKDSLIDGEKSNEIVRKNEEYIFR